MIEDPEELGVCAMTQGGQHHSPEYKLGRHASTGLAAQQTKQHVYWVVKDQDMNSVSACCAQDQLRTRLVGASICWQHP